MENIDFNTDGVSYDVFKERFYRYLLDVVSFCEDKTDFEEKLLKPLFNSEIKGKKDITQLFKNYSFTIDEENDAALQNLIFLLKGYKGDLNKIKDIYDSKSLTVMDLKKNSYNLTELEEHIIELFDLINIANILSNGCSYLCEVAVNNLEDFIYIMDVMKQYKLKEKVKCIDISNNYEYIIYLADEKKKVHIGDTSNLSNKILYVQAIIEQEKGTEGDIFVNGDLNNGFNPYFRDKV